MLFSEELMLVKGKVMPLKAPVKFLLQVPFNMLWLNLNNLLNEKISLLTKQMF